MTSHAGIFASKLTVGIRARITAREVYSMASYRGSYYSRYYIYSADSSRGSANGVGQVK